MSGAAPERAPAARAYVGLGLLGWGLAILLEVAPHEDPWIGAGLAAFGAGLVATSPRKPHVERLPRVLIGILGAAATTATLAYDAWFHSPLNVTKTAILALGSILAASSPFLNRPFRIRGLRRPFFLASLVACLVPLFGVPLLLWGFQAVFKSLLGTTPIESFIHFGLLVPMAAALGLLEWHPVVAGQIIEYATPRGPLRVEVGAACSGVEAMALFGGVLALYVLLERPKGSRLAVWTAIGILGVYVANLLRLTVLALVGYAWGSDALLQVHAQAGWTFFVAWAILFAWMARPSRSPNLGTTAGPSRPGNEIVERSPSPIHPGKLSHAPTRGFSSK